MALIRAISHVTKDRQGRHGPVDGGWSTFAADGATYFQLDTYGTDERQDVSTVSQSIQLDRDRAADLISILRQVYPDI